MIRRSDGKLRKISRKLPGRISSGRLSKDLPGPPVEDRLRRLVEGGQHSRAVDGDEADRHVLHEAVGEGLDPREGAPRGAVALGQEERDDPRDSR